MLWNTSILSPHFRSVQDVGNIVITPNDITSSTITVLPGLPSLAGAEFFTVAGGLVTIDVGTLPPSIGRGVVLRGGISKLTFANPNGPQNLGATSGDSIRVKVFAVWASADPTGIVIPTTVPVSWDPTILADFKQFGRVLFTREFMLEPEGKAVDIVYRFRPWKIDRAIFNLLGSQLLWVIQSSQLTNTETVTAGEQLTIVRGHNVSFSADQI